MTQLCFRFHVGPPIKLRHHSALIIVSFSFNKKSLEANIETNVTNDKSKTNQKIFFHISNTFVMTHFSWSFQ